MSRRNIIWTIIFGLSCSLGIVFGVLWNSALYFVLTLALLCLAVFSRFRIN